MCTYYAKLVSVEKYYIYHTMAIVLVVTRTAT